MIAIIRIRGQVKLKNEIAETFYRLRLRKKLTCVVIDEKDVVRTGMLKKVSQYVAYGKIDDKLFKELVEKRGELKPEVKKEKVKPKKTKDNIKPFFRLHPPIGGFKKTTKKDVGQNGILGNHEDIGKLLRRML